MGNQNNDNNAGNTAFNNYGNQTQNIYSNTQFKSFNQQSINKIKCHQNLLTISNIKNWTFFIFFGISLLVFFSDINSEIEYHPFISFVIAVIFISIPFIILSFIFAFVIQFSKYKTLSITEFGFKFDEKILLFEDIRSVLKIKDLIGYSIFIYSIDEIFPVIQFNLETVHESNAMNDFIIKSIENKNN